MVLRNYKGEKVTAGIVDRAIRDIIPNPKGFMLRTDFRSIEKWKVTGIVASSLLTNSIVGVALQKGSNFIICLESGLDNENCISVNAKILETCYKNDILVYQIGSPWSINQDVLFSLLSKLIGNEKVTLFSIPEISFCHVIFNSTLPLPFHGLFDRFLRGAITFSQKLVTDHESQRIILLEKPINLNILKKLGVDTILTFHLTPDLMYFSKKNRMMSIIINYQIFLNELLRILVIRIANELGAEIIPVLEKNSEFKVI